MESLLLDIPFVCKSWHKETLNPSCWNSLIFPDFEPEFPYNERDYPIFDRFVSEFGLDRDHFSVTAFIKFVVNRSQGNAVSLKLPGCSSLEAFEYVTDECPNIMFFGLPRCLLWKDEIDLELMGKFKNLFMLALGCSTYLDRVLAIDRDYLIILLKGCKELVMLEAKDCIGFDEGDDELAKMASHVKSFHCEGSKERFEHPYNMSSFYQFFSSLTKDRVKEIGSMFAEIDAEAEVDGEGEGEGEGEVDIEDRVEP